MSVKQDGVYARTASDLERKYSFGKTFAEMLGLINDSRDKVDSVESTLRGEIRETSTTITRNSEEIVSSALENYETATESAKKREELKADLEVTARDISMDFYKGSTEQIEGVDGELQSVVENLQKHFIFDVDGLTIKAGENEMQLHIDNDKIRFLKNGEEFGWWDGVDFHTGNIFVAVSKRAQFGSFAFVPRSNGSLSFLKVGG